MTYRCLTCNKPFDFPVYEHETNREAVERAMTQYAKETDGDSNAPRIIFPYGGYIRSYPICPHCGKRLTV